MCEPAVGLNNSSITTTVYKSAATLLYSTEYIVKRQLHEIFTMSGQGVGLAVSQQLNAK
jgi:hypothetical protein